MESLRLLMPGLWLMAFAVFVCVCCFILANRVATRDDIKTARLCRHLVFLAFVCAVISVLVTFL